MSSQQFAPVTPLRPAWQIAVLAGVASLLVSAVGVWYLGHSEPATFTWRSWFLLGISFAMAFSGSAWAAAQWMSPSGRAGFWRPVLGLGVALAGLITGAKFDEFEPALAGMCLSIGSVFAAGSCLLLLLIFRRTAPIMRQRVAVAIGVLSGFTGFCVIQLHCPVNEFWHMMTGHAILPVLWGLIGYWAGRLAFR